jgi:amino acid transporter
VTGAKKMENLSHNSEFDQSVKSEMEMRVESLSEDPGHGLHRRLGFLDGVCVLVSIIIGSGIFASPGVALERSGSPGAALMAWTVSGFLVIVASMCYAELGAMIPSTGGDFDYLNRAYGKSAAFSFAWFLFWISKPGSQAIIATVFGNYVVRIFTGLNNSSDGSPAAKAAGVLLIIVLTLVNCVGVHATSSVANLLMVTKLALVALVVAAGIYRVSDSQEIFKDNLTGENAFEGTDLTGMGPAMIACLWAYDGWSNLNFLAEEMINFEARLPMLIVGSTCIVIISYVSVNLAYFAVLTSDDVENSDAIAIDFGQSIPGTGNILAGIFAGGVALSAAGSCNGSILTGGRGFYAVAREKMAPEIFSRLNSARAPQAALFAQAAWCIVLILLPGSNFSTLLDYAGPAGWLYYAFTGSSVIYLRYKEPDLPRPFRVPLYPLPPILLVIISFYLVITSIIKSPLYCSLALFFVAISVPVWWLVERHQAKEKEGAEPLLAVEVEAD